MLKFSFGFRLLNDEEKEVISKVLKPFGFLYEGHGTCQVTEEGKVIYHLDFNTGPVATLGYELGAKLRKALKADEVYKMGNKL